VSAPEPRSKPRAAGVSHAAGVSLAACLVDIVEIAAFRECAPVLLCRAHEHGLTLPPHGRVAAVPGGLALTVRPERWLLLLAPADRGANALHARQICGTAGAAIELSSALAALHLTGSAVREVMKRGCRLDLDPAVFPAGAAAASAMAQVAVILAALPSGLLLLTPATTARHLREWLASTARPFGFESGADVTVSVLSGDQRP
jgi:heterotetrameric sarcosine oxidase gamma subunit